MRISRWKSGVAAAVAIFGIAVFLSASPGPPGAQTVAQTSKSHEVVLTFDTAQSKVHYVVDTTLHTVHGTFAMKSGSVEFDPETGKASGEIVVLATSGESGNSSRDERMHKEIIQSDKYPEAVFKPNQIEGKVASSGNSDSKVHGSFLFHGTSHDIVVPIHVELSKENWKGTGKFDVPYIQWGLKNPSNFLLKVQPIVNIELEMAGSFKSSN